MGTCIRTGAHLTLDLPRFVWKQLASQVIVPEDIKEIDQGFWNLLTFMLSSDERVFEEAIDETYQVTLSDGSQEELHADGAAEKVTF